MWACVPCELLISNIDAELQDYQCLQCGFRLTETISGGKIK